MVRLRKDLCKWWVVFLGDWELSLHIGEPRILGTILESDDRKFG